MSVWETATLTLKIATVLIYLVGFTLLIIQAIRARRATRALNRSLAELAATAERLNAVLASSMGGQLRGEDEAQDDD